MSVAVMGCVVNGPGESKAANIGISLPGTGESPNCPVFIDGEHVTTLRGNLRRAGGAFQKLIDDYVERKYPFGFPRDRPGARYFADFLKLLTTLPSGWPWIATYARTTSSPGASVPIGSSPVRTALSGSLVVRPPG